MKLTIIVPGIRTHLWEEFCKSVNKSCKDYSFEIIFIGPFLPTSNILKDNVFFINSYSPVPVCIQKASLLAKGEFICHAVDDSLFHENALDECVSIANRIGNKDSLSLTYVENTNEMTSLEKWSVANNPEFWLSNIDKSWITFVQPMMRTGRFFELGGFNCEFEYSNHCHHDLAFRLQKTNGKIYIPNFTVSTASHMPNRTGDHGPIHDCQTTTDLDKFKNLWSKEINPIIDYDNWKIKDKVWKRRFSQQYKSYEEMAKGEKYVF